MAHLALITAIQSFLIAYLALITVIRCFLIAHLALITVIQSFLIAHLAYTYFSDSNLFHAKNVKSFLATITARKHYFQFRYFS